MRLPILFALCSCALSFGEGNWPAWRGPTMDGRAADAAAPPIEWSEEKHLRWKVPITGVGTSTPSVWGNQVILTSALKTGRTVEMEQPSGDSKKIPPNDIYEFQVMSFNRTTGDLLWKTVVVEAVPHERCHETGSYASASTVTDGKRIFAFFGSRGLFALDMNGNQLWDKQFPRMKTLAEFGEGASPALGKDILVIPWDEEGQSFVAGIEASSGKELWRTLRDADSAWTTPLVQRDGDTVVAIVSGSDETKAYDITTGAERWTCDGMSKNPVASPVAADGIVYISNSYEGNVLQAIRLAGAVGELAEDPTHLLWKYDESASYVPTPVIHDRRLYFLRNTSGVMDCLDARSGAIIFQGKRLGLSRVHASPIVANGRMYIASREGLTLVIELGTELEVVARNQLADVFDASPVAVGNELILRGRQNLYCIAE